MQESNPIRLALDRIKLRPAGSPRPVAVFDLDSTLFHTGARNLAIAQAFSEIRPQLAPWIPKLDPDHMGWNIMQDLQALGFQDKTVLEELASFWRATFFTDRFVQLDPPYEGAVELVEEVLRAGCFVYYLTGRDEYGMKEGTLASLAQHGFPMPGEGVFLQLKPTWEMDDRIFKQEVFAALRRLGDVVLAFENDPTNANRFQEEWPEALVVLHETIEPPGAETPLPNILCVQDLRLG